MPQMPIPDDWNGEDWRCITVEFPDSPKYLALLVGYLSQNARGHFWDKRTGTITDAQDIGREIFYRNFPLNDCAGGEVETEIDAETVFIMCGDGCTDCEDEMSCSIPRDVLRWAADGRLQYLSCGTWYYVEGAMVADAAIGDDYIAPEIDGGGYSACGKANAVMELVHQLITSIFDEVDNFFFQWWGHIKGDMPGVGMDAKWIMTAVSGAVAQKLADQALQEAYEPDEFDESTWQSVKCALARDFSNTMPEALDGNAIRSKLQSYFASEWGVDVLTNAVFVDALRGLNASTFEDAVRAGASDDEESCDCPLTGEEYEGVLRFTEDFTSAEPDELTLVVGGSGRYVDVTWEVPSGVFRGNGDFFIDMAGSDADIDDVTIRVSPLQGSNMPVDEWHDFVDCPKVNPADWDDVYFEPGAGRIDTRVNFSGSYTNEFEWPASVTVPTCKSSPRKCGADDSPARTYRYRIEIIKLNGVDY